jgi:hypothetical protein
MERQRVGIEIGSGIDPWPAFHYRDIDALTSQMRRQGTARGPGPHDDDIVCLTLHPSET